MKPCDTATREAYHTQPGQLHSTSKTTWFAVFRMATVSQYARRKAKEYKVSVVNFSSCSEQQLIHISTRSSIEFRGEQTKHLSFPAYSHFCPENNCAKLERKADLFSFRTLSAFTLQKRFLQQLHRAQPGREMHQVQRNDTVT